MDEQWIKGFTEKLDNNHVWPDLYTFKFIVPKGKEEELKNLFPHHESSTRASKNGNYSSLTFRMMMPSSQAVIEVYKAAAQISGIIAL